VRYGLSQLGYSGCRGASDTGATCPILSSFGTSRLKVVVTGVAVFGLFGNFSLANFYLSFFLGYFKA